MTGLPASSPLPGSFCRSSSTASDNVIYQRSAPASFAVAPVRPADSLLQSRNQRLDLPRPSVPRWLHPSASGSSTLGPSALRFVRAHHPAQIYINVVRRSSAEVHRQHASSALSSVDNSNIR
ncbi:hypothetical protein ACLOJK_008041 [Asimina triloba]